jgi:hypothetical protein
MIDKILHLFGRHCGKWGELKRKQVISEVMWEANLATRQINRASHTMVYQTRYCEICGVYQERDAYRVVTGETL